MVLAGQGGARWWRWAGLLLLLLLAIHAARVALVRSEAATRPDVALAVWPDYPDALFTVALAGIGRAAGEGRAPDPALIDLVERGSRKAPLAPQPLWVAAAARMEAGDPAAAERLLRAAIRLDARAPAARFLLADLAIRQGRLELALGELAALERRVGGLSAGFAPALVTYLHQPGALDRTGPLLAANPVLRQSVLARLATGPRDLPLLLALARPGDDRASWFLPTAQRLLAAGAVEEVRQLLGRSSARPQAGGEGLTDWTGQSGDALFGWRFPPGRGGLAEPVAGGPLRLIHYGREEMVLAEHLLLLRPGRYRLSAQFSSPVPAGALEWRLHCLSGNRQIAAAAAGAGRQDLTLTVDPGCRAQRLSLVGRTGEVAQTLRTELREVRLEREGAGE